MDQRTYENLLTIDVDRLIDRYVTSFDNPMTERGYRDRLTTYLKWCDDKRYHPLALTVHQLNEYRDHVYESSWAEKTKEARYFGVRAFFRYLMRQGLRPENPFDHRDAAPTPAYRPSLELPDAVSWPVYREVMHWALQNPEDHASPVVLLLGLNALKPAEVEGASVGDVRLPRSPAARTFLMLPSRGPTARTPLEGPLTQIAKTACEERGEGALVLNANGERISHSSIRLAVNRAARQAGISVNDVSPNRLRSAAGLVAAREGLSLRGLKDMLGIQDRTAVRYFAVADAELQMHGATVVWRRLTLGEPASDLFSQVERLLEDPNITPTAPIVLTGAGLEQHLVRLCEANGLRVGEKPSIDKLKGRLVGAELLSPPQGADVERWGRWRNDEAHGRARASLEDAHTMLREVRDFVAATGGLLRGEPRE